MFFKQIRRNASRNRAGNGLFFGSLIIAIIAFYTLLSLGGQDVILFLKTIESDAVRKLMSMLPIIYMVSLFFVFFLVYFAYYYQLDNRKKEFGVYLMLGMKRSKLFTMLMSETLWNSMISVLIGLPTALLLTECSSLATAKVVGLGIVGHKISFSTTAILGTVIGFISVQMIAMLFLSIKFSSKEPVKLLQMDTSEKQVSPSSKKGFVFFGLGCILLITAYVIGITMRENFNLKGIAFIFVFGGSGTFLLYYGMGAFIGTAIQRKSGTKSGLFIFTGRQIQENVLHQYKSLAIASLLLLMALTGISFGIGVVVGRDAIDARSVDFSIEGTKQEVSEVLEREENSDWISTYYPMFVGNTNINKVAYSLEGLGEALASQPESDLKNNMMENISNRFHYVISVDSYNNLLASIGKKPLLLEKNQAALYSSMSRENRDFYQILSGALKSDAYIELDGERYELLPEVYSDNIVADRKITIYTAYIVTDEVYQEWAENSKEPLCFNVLLHPNKVEEIGLMQAIKNMEQNLMGTGLHYESYLGGIGRNLFYTVAASYITIYLGILFLIIANTVIGLKFLMQQRSNKQRYMILQMLGTSTNALCNSSKRQIQLFFVLVISVATCNSAFAIWFMFTSLMRLPAGTSMGKVMLATGLAFILFVVIEFVYIHIVTKTSSREIRAYNVTDRR